MVLETGLKYLLWDIFPQNPYGRQRIMEIQILQKFPQPQDWPQENSKPAV